MKAHATTRRSFLKISAGAAGAAALGGPLILCGATAKSTAANDSLRLAVIGCGGRGRADMRNILGCGVRLVALCDPDRRMIARARSAAGSAGKAPKAYQNFHRLLDDASSFDIVLVATPDHWHYHVSKAVMEAGKHIYCEKPLTHSVSEARELRKLSHQCKVVTQMGNQGSASASLRRCEEIIRAGALGEIRRMYEWGIGVTANEGSAPGQDPIPPQFNWDLWVGPSAMRPFRKGVYHPFKWRHWFDFGNGGLADIGCHTINLPSRALDLGYPDRIGINVHNGKQTPGKAAVEFYFAARGKLPPAVLYWQGQGLPPAKILQPLRQVYTRGLPGGLMIEGTKGCIYTSHWNTGGLIRLNGEARLTDVLHHKATQDIPVTLPRVRSHAQEWVDACRGKGKTFSPFEIGGQLTEVVLAGVVGVRAGKSLDWDGPDMRATNDPSADRFIHTVYRKKWLS